MISNRQETANLLRYWHCMAARRFTNCLVSYDGWTKDL